MTPGGGSVGCSFMREVTLRARNLLSARLPHGARLYLGSAGVRQGGYNSTVMARRDWTSAALMFFVGLAVGAGVVAGYRPLHQGRSGEVFSRRLRCSELANQYAKSESNDARSVSAETVGYSEASNSCVAYFTILETVSPQYDVQEWRVMDLLSGERLHSDNCRSDRDCGDGNDMKFGRRSEVAFQQAVKGEQVDVSRVK